MKTCVIVNPAAGSMGEIADLRERLGRLPDAVVRQTTAPGDAERLAREALEDGASQLVAAGGDGTLNEIVNGLAGDFGQAQLGLIPLGTGNDFSRSVGIPSGKDGIAAAIALLETGAVRAVDVGRAVVGEASRFFLNMSAGGFSGEVSERAGEAKDRWGPLAYMRAALGSLTDLRSYLTTITVNGAETLHLETYNIVISNGRYVAAGIPAAPEAILDDGVLDVMIYPAASLPQLARLVPMVLLGRHTDSDLLLFRRATRIEVECEPSMAFNADGELLEEGPARFEVLPRALRVVVGPEAAEGVFSSPA